MKVAVVLLAVPALLAGCFAGPPAAGVATGQIDGAVVDHLLRPFGNQSVYLLQLDRADRTSALGGFTFRDVPVGFHTLTTSLPSGQAATHVVGVEADKVTRIILQLLPLPTDDPFFLTFPFTSPGETPQADAVCSSCEWAVPLGGDRPAQVTFEALWDSGPFLVEDHDRLDITISDDRGFPLYRRSELSSPVLPTDVVIEGADIHPDARELRITVSYGKEFLPSTQDFTMHSVVTLYYGATKEQMFAVPA